jgi:beta-lactamase regulating signal transducer with metallopeptidase domain/cell division septation protein DedD
METASQCVLTFLLNAGWQIAVVAAIAAAASRLIRKGPASYRSAGWGAALALSILMPAFSLWQREARAPLLDSVSLRPAPATAPLPGAVPPAPPVMQPATRSSAVRLPWATANAVLVLYLCVLIFRAAAFARAFNAARRVRKSAQPLTPQPPLDRVWARCREALGITRVDLFTSPSAASPLTVGVFRPAIVLPADFQSELREDVLTAAIGHEMAHVARRDFALNVLYELLYLPVSFHPACWLMLRNIESSREMACDEAVTSRLLDAPRYAQSILTIADAMTAAQSTGYALGVFDGNVLESRIRRVLKRPAFSLRRTRLLLATAGSAMAVCAVVASSLAVTARAQAPFQAEMKLAGDAYNSGDFKTAVDHFSAAVALEPLKSNARLFLANALLSAYRAARDTHDVRLLNAAREQYEGVLKYEPSSAQAIAGMTTLAIEAKRFEEARAWAEKLAAADPNDKTVWYTLGVLDWASAYPRFQLAKQRSGSPPESYFISDPAIRKTLRDAQLPRVEDGIRMLQRALALDPQYGEAMAYTNLLYRLKSAMVDDAAEAKDLLAKADAMVGQALAARKARVPTPKVSRIDVEGPPPGPAGANVIIDAPPPPPPPPPRDKAYSHASGSPPPPPEPGTVNLPGTYWQVTGSNPDTPAIDLFRQLNATGIPAALHAGADHLTRVVVGPFFDEASAQQARQKAEAAGFHVVRKLE